MWQEPEDSTDRSVGWRGFLGTIQAMSYQADQSATKKAFLPGKRRPGAVTSHDIDRREKTFRP